MRPACSMRAPCANVRSRRGLCSAMFYNRKYQPVIIMEKVVHSSREATIIMLLYIIVIIKFVSIFTTIVMSLSLPLSLPLSLLSLSLSLSVSQSLSVYLSPSVSLCFLLSVSISSLFGCLLTGYHATRFYQQHTHE